MDNLEQLCTELITSTGDARSLFIQAIDEAKKGRFDAAEACMKEGEASFMKGHASHSDFVEKAGKGEDIPFSLILVHAEDMLMSAESFKILAAEFVDVYKKIG